MWGVDFRGPLFVNPLLGFGPTLRPSTARKPAFRVGEDFDRRCRPRGTITREPTDAAFDGSATIEGIPWHAPDPSKDIET